MVGIGLCVLLLGSLWTYVEKLRSQRVSLAANVLLMFSAITAGLYFVWVKRSVVDDAFISFRFADNWLNGRGLVWNEGEYVEGITNFLWTLIVGIAAWLLPWDMPDIALWLCVFCYLANIGVVLAVSRCLFRSGKGSSGYYLPVAASLLAVQWTTTAYATTGLETAFISLLVDLGLLAL
ncbi:MAG: hypothetical protein HN348_25005, partial [Proteobacteria bacterium]|nr:hypothetical protein [Pseudomonadota bacterium]